MSEDWGEWFARVSEDQAAPEEARVLATKLYTGWMLGVIPSPSSVRILRELCKVDMGCDRMEWDGACAWLKQWAGKFGYPEAPPGEKAMCQFVNNWVQCPGVRPHET